MTGYLRKNVRITHWSDYKTAFIKFVMEYMMVHTHLLDSETGSRTLSTFLLSYQTPFQKMTSKFPHIVGAWLPNQSYSTS